MHRLSVATGDGLRRVLVIGAHADDIEIGCGGTLLTLLRARPDVHVTWFVLSASGDRAKEARASAETFLGTAGSYDLRLLELRDGFLPYGPEAKEAFEALKPEIDPQLILTHARNDLHQDHRTVCELTWNTFRDNLILEYEVPKYDGDLGRPGVYVELSADVAREKVELLLRHFPSQSVKHWFDAETFTGLMRLRGLEGKAKDGYAEAFYGPKLVVSL
jgi:LmbE family N-acetylglucosaminyl deacetylase